MAVITMKGRRGPSSPRGGGAGVLRSTACAKVPVWSSLRFDPAGTFLPFN